MIWYPTVYELCMIHPVVEVSCPVSSIKFPWPELRIWMNLLQELSEPILELSALYDQDGWCLFGYLGTWASECAISRRKHNVIKFATQLLSWQELFWASHPMPPMLHKNELYVISNFWLIFWAALFSHLPRQRWFDQYATYINVPWATPFALRLPDNRTLIIRDHIYPLDDLYCYVNGWYSLPRHEVVNNFSYLEEVSNRFCDHLAEIVPGYHNISLMDLVKESKADEAFLENLMKNGADTGYVPQSVIDGMYLHAATKCVMRGHLVWIRFAMAWKTGKC